MFRARGWVSLIVCFGLWWGTLLLPAEAYEERAKADDLRENAIALARCD